MSEWDIHAIIPAQQITQASLNELPVNAVIPSIRKTLSESSGLILQAPPGAGKTTLVPLALLDQPWLDDKKIVLLEPRRLAARTVAARMAALLDEKLGERVGFQIRADRCVSSKTKILVVTEGILTRMLQDDPGLDDVALVIFDEFHERNLHADLALAFAIQSQELLREDLKIMVMSATLNTQELTKVLVHAPIIESEGRSYPVENIYVEPFSTPKEGVVSPSAERRKRIRMTADLIIQLLEEHSGNFLVFLPGVGEIKQLQSHLNESLRVPDNAKYGSIVITPLYGELNQKQQEQAIRSTQQGQRKVVLATNIAETSLTIDGISVVIDLGLQRISIFNPRLAMNQLQTVPISLDSAQQRSGRAGRLGPGVCYRLWSETKQNQLIPHQTPEILYSDLTPVVLELAKWGVQDIDELAWLDEPNPGAVSQAKELLGELQAIDVAGRITPRGELILKLGLHPRLAHMLISAVSLGLAYEACLLAAVLTEKDIFSSRSNIPSRAQSNTYANKLGNYRLNLTDRLQVLLAHSKPSEVESGLDKKQVAFIKKTAQIWFQRLQKAFPDQALKSTTDGSKHLHQKTSRLEYLGVLTAFAYPDRIAQCRNKGQGRYLMSSGKGAFIDPRYDYADSEYVVIADLDANQQSNEAKVYRLAEISREQLEEHFSHLIQEAREIKWNRVNQRVECVKVTGLAALTLDKTTLDKSLLTGDELTTMQKQLLEGVKDIGLNCLNWSKKALNFQQRMVCLKHFLALHKDKAAMCITETSEPWPDLSEAYLLEHLEEWLAPYLTQQTSIKQLQQLELYDILLAQMDWSQQQLLDKLLPTHFKVPSGSQIAIDYSNPEKPILAVKLQELFGLQKTPSVLNGQLRLLLHLLSPAMRPMQVTEDLNNFWNQTYPQVKKELQGKYKKHYWPDDPITAKATNRVKRFMN